MILYNWYVANLMHQPVNDDFDGPKFLIGQVLNDTRREDGKWIATSRINSPDTFETGVEVRTNNSTYLLDRPASKEVLEKVLSGEYGGTRGEPFILEKGLDA